MAVALSVMAWSDGQSIVNEQGFEMGRLSQFSVEIHSKNGEILGVRVGGGCVEMGEGNLFLR